MSRWYDLILYWMLAGLGAAVFLAARGLTYRSDFGPGPGFLPTWLGVALVVLGAGGGLVTALDLRSSRREVPGEVGARLTVDISGSLRPGLVLAGLLFTALAFEPLGVPLALALLLLYLLGVVERVGLALTLAVTSSLVLAVWLIFFQMLQLPLSLGFWLAG